MISDTHLRQLLVEEEQGSFVLCSTKQNQTTSLLQTVKSRVVALDDEYEGTVSMQCNGKCTVSGHIFLPAEDFPTYHGGLVRWS